MAELMSTVEAFHAMLRAKYPDREDLLQIKSRHQLVYAKSFELQDPAPAHEVLAALRAEIASGKIQRFQGVQNGAMPAEINQDHVKRGELDFFDGTLTVEDKDELGFTHRKIYRHVYFYADDLTLPRSRMQVYVANQPLSKKNGDKEPVPQQHCPGDTALIEEGVQMAEAGKRFRAIGRELAPRAVEGNSIDAKAERLRRAISKEYKRRHPRVVSQFEIERTSKKPVRDSEKEGP
jgi:hypothetical protein